MGLLERFWDPLKRGERAQRQYHLEAIVKAATAGAMRQVAGTEPAVFAHRHNGAIGIDPRFLAVWYVFSTEADFKAARVGGLTGLLDRSTRELLEARGYPKFAVSFIAVSFTSDEDIRKKTSGNYEQYFK